MVLAFGQAPVKVWKIWVGEQDVWEMVTMEEWELVLESTLVGKDPWESSREPRAGGVHGACYAASWPIVVWS